VKKLQSRGLWPHAYVGSVLFGAGYFALNVHWLMPITIPGYITLCMFFGMVAPLAALGIRQAKRRGVPMAIAAPVAWVAFEYLRSIGGLAFPVVLLGHSQYQHLSIIQVADLVGAYGVSFMLVQLVGYRELGRWSYPLFVVTLGALALLLIARYVPMSPFIVERRNSYRWITIGPMNFQVSEYAKISFILALAYYLRYRTNYRSIVGLLMPFVLTLVPMAMILKEPDLGTSLLLLPTLFVMFYDAIHPKPYAAKLMAKAIADVVMDELKVARR